MNMLTFRPGGNALEVYRMTAGFYRSGDSNAWIVSAHQFAQFIELQACRQHLVGLLTIGPRTSGPSRPTVKDALLERIQARADAIKSRRGILSESYPLIREDREDR
jgi:hypothetical protein